MTVIVSAWRDEGPLTNGRGLTTRQVTNFNMKASSIYENAYYPTKLFPAAPLYRSLIPGEQVLSYTVYTYFKLEGTYNTMKNPKIVLSVSTPGEADKVQLFYRMTNVYKTPSNAFDPDMSLLATGNNLIITDLYPNLSTVGPHMATSRQTGYANVSPLYTNYLVTQVRVNANSLVGNTAEFSMQFEIKEYGIF